MLPDPNGKAIASLAACQKAERAAKRKAAFAVGGRAFAPLGAAIGGWEIGDLIKMIPTEDGGNVGEKIRDWGDNSLGPYIYR